MHYSETLSSHISDVGVKSSGDSLVTRKDYQKLKKQYEDLQQQMAQLKELVTGRSGDASAMLYQSDQMRFYHGQYSTTEDINHQVLRCAQSYTQPTYTTWNSTWEDNRSDSADLFYQ